MPEVYDATESPKQSYVLAAGEGARGGDRPLKVSKNNISKSGICHK